MISRTFGNLDVDVLESVLEVNNGDVNLATQYLQADAGGYAFNPQQEGSVPSDYPGQTVPFPTPSPPLPLLPPSPSRHNK